MERHESTTSKMMMTRILVLMVFIQTALILALFGKIAALEKEVVSLGPVETKYPADNPFSQRRTEDKIDDPLAASGEELLRRIIREELSAQPLGESDPDHSGVAVVPTVDPAEMQRRRDAIDQQIDYYSSIGQISETEMQALQAEIATLDTSGRREMLGKLTRAMNSGSIRGHL